MSKFNCPVLAVDAVPTTVGRTYTHPDVFTVGIRDGWADPEDDPTRIDWTTRLAGAAIPFRVVDGRPVSPFPPTGIRYGRNELGHWGEQRCADALVVARDWYSCYWIVMVERSDGHGWALPGGYVDAGEDPVDAAVRELREETCLVVDRTQDSYIAMPARGVPDPRASDEAWMVTVVTRFDIGDYFSMLPPIEGADDAKRAAWVRADTYDGLVDDLRHIYGGCVFAAHQELLADLLG